MQIVHLIEPAQAVEAWHTTCKKTQIPVTLPEWFGRAESIIAMLSHCANTQCHKPFLRLREGKLFLVETDLTKPGEPTVPPFVRARRLQRLVEHYWLCDECAAQWTLVFDRENGVALVPVKRAVQSVTAAAAHTGAA